MTKPFAGVRILDFTRYLAGPYGTYQLAPLGADVVKIESRDGDETRGQLADPKWAERKMAPSFMAVNGNKRSITLDLRRPEAVEVVIDEVVRHPQLAHRAVLQTIDSRYGPLRLVGAGFELAHGSPGLDREPPTLGEHTDQILEEAAYTAEDIAELRRQGVI